MTLALLAATSAGLLVSCAVSDNPPKPGTSAAAAVENGLAPKIIAGSQLHYADNHGKNVYTFLTGGRFRFATMSQNQTTADSREGKYTYAITSPDNALISLDKNSAIRLRFDNPLTARGTVDDDVRTYRFTITRPDGE